MKKAPALPPLDELDRRLMDLLRVNARMPTVQMAKALCCARSTVQLRIRALEKSGHITGYTLSTAAPQEGLGIRAMVLIGTTSSQEGGIVAALCKRPEVRQLWAVSGRYDLCAMLNTDSTEDLNEFLDRLRAMPGVDSTVSTLLLSSKLDRPA